MRTLPSLLSRCRTEAFSHFRMRPNSFSHKASYDWIGLPAKASHLLPSPARQTGSQLDQELILASSALRNEKS
ncbi:hypothetical protein RGR602_CH03639 [Rhizobium gallicum bv. gallicum R602sp]|uniref:Uncharacterized protein n=1 Tax=Rhizobium gallicum bv. gallicum R602sp TaxID=1041138 RepID=A0A0B4X724_9HYPH|nr:hypothetical protein RGR602_CH03639 [Rhizobium gallicum bv. gallicum R602sp]